MGTVTSANDANQASEEEGAASPEADFRAPQSGEAPALDDGLGNDGPPRRTLRA